MNNWSYAWNLKIDRFQRFTSFNSIKSNFCVTPVNNQKEIKLSSSWGNVGLYGGALLCIMMITPIYLAITNQRFHIGMIIGLMLFLLLIGFVIYQFIYVCDARIIDNKLVLKKKFRSSKAYTFDKIDYISSFQLKTTKYITVEIKIDNISTLRS